MTGDLRAFIFTFVLYDILCVLCFLLCMFVLYVTVLLPVGVTEHDDDDDNDDDHDRMLTLHAIACVWLSFSQSAC